MKIIVLNLIFLFTSFGFLEAQNSDTIFSSAQTIFEEKIAKFIGLPSPLFEAPDLTGHKHYLDKYQDHVVILHFWQAFSYPSTTQIPSLNRIIDEYFDKGVVVLGFATNDIEDLTMFKKEQGINYPLIPNSLEFSNKYYGGEMGYPRVFLIDKYGVVQNIYIGAKSGEYMNLYHQLVPLIEEQLKY